METPICFVDHATNPTSPERYSPRGRPDPFATENILMQLSPFSPEDLKEIGFSQGTRRCVFGTTGTTESFEAIKQYQGETGQRKHVLIPLVQLTSLDKSKKTSRDHKKRS